jgi:hypothetical protein
MIAHEFVYQGARLWSLEETRALLSESASATKGIDRESYPESTWRKSGLMDTIKLAWIATVIIVTSVSAWIVGIRMRRRIKRALGQEATEVELT